MKRTKRRRINKGTYGKIGLLFLIICLFAICLPSSHLRANQTKKLLMLHSYHQGLGWTDRINQGIESALNKSDQEIDFHVEYMDGKRIYDDQHLQNLCELYRHKYRNRRFDAIISSDDHAFRFLLAHHRELFPGTPIVFCGVNNFEDSVLLGHDLITGVVESFDIKGTLEVSLKLQPGIKQVFVIVDKTLSGQIVKDLMIKEIPSFEDVLRFIFLEDLDMSEVLERVKSLSNDSIVFLISLVIDKSGNTFSFEKSCALISQKSAVPIYSHSDAYLGHGIVGGKLNCGDAQGKMAGEMASRILGGENVRTVSVIKKSPNRYMFDYQQMQRFGIKLSSLPEGSVVINKPYSFYSTHKRKVWSVIAGIAGLVLIILILSINIINRRRGEEMIKESEEKYRSLVESTEDSIYLVDKDCRYLFMNQKHLSRFGALRDKVIGRAYDEFHSKKETNEFAKRVNEVFENARSLSYEYRSDRDGGYYIRTLSPVKGPDGTMTAVTVDSKNITEFKQAEETIKLQLAEITYYYDNLPIGLAVLDRNLRFLKINDMLAQINGIPAEDHVNKTVKEIVPTLETQFRKITEEIIRTGNSVKDIELVGEIPAEPGVKHVWLEGWHPLKDNAGKITGFNVVVQDVTELKKAEEALKQTNEELLRGHNQRKMLSKRLIDLLEKDRRQIAMELHDHIGQTLTSIKMDIEMIHGKLKPEQRELGFRITAAQERTIQAIKDIKNISHGLRPPMIDALGVVSSLRELCNEVQQQTDMEIHFFSKRIPKRFEEEKELAIYRITQEALTNIIRHAQAKNVFMNLVKKDEKLSLSVEDDGAGFDYKKTMQASRNKGALGLLIMRERAEQLEGDFTLESQIGKGTHLLVEIPI